MTNKKVPPQPPAFCGLCVLEPQRTSLGRQIPRRPPHPRVRLCDSRLPYVNYISRSFDITKPTEIPRAMKSPRRQKYTPRYRLPSHIKPPSSSPAISFLHTYTQHTNHSISQQSCQATTPTVSKTPRSRLSTLPSKPTPRTLSTMAV